VAAPERVKINSKRGYGGAYGRLGEPVHGRGQAEVAMIRHMNYYGSFALKKISFKFVCGIFAFAKARQRAASDKNNPTKLTGRK